MEIKLDVIKRLADKNVFIVRATNSGVPNAKTQIINWVVSYAVLVDAIYSAREKGETWSLKTEELMKALKLGNYARFSYFLKWLEEKRFLESKRVGTSKVYSPTLGNATEARPVLIPAFAHPTSSTVDLGTNIFHKILQSPRADGAVTKKCGEGFNVEGYTLISYNYGSFIKDEDSNILAMHSTGMDNPRLKATWLSSLGVKSIPDDFKVIELHNEAFWEAATKEYFSTRHASEPVNSPTPFWEKIHPQFWASSSNETKTSVYNEMLKVTNAKARSFGSPQDYYMRIPNIWKYMGLSEFQADDLTRKYNTAKSESNKAPLPTYPLQPGAPAEVPAVTSAPLTTRLDSKITPAQLIAAATKGVETEPENQEPKQILHVAPPRDYRYQPRNVRRVEPTPVGTEPAATVADLVANMTTVTATAATAAQQNAEPPLRAGVSRTSTGNGDIYYDILDIVNCNLSEPMKRLVLRQYMEARICYEIRKGDLQVTK